MDGLTKETRDTIESSVYEMADRISFSILGGDDRMTEEPIENTLRSALDDLKYGRQSLDETGLVEAMMLLLDMESKQREYLKKVKRILENHNRHKNKGVQNE